MHEIEILDDREFDDLYNQLDVAHQMIVDGTIREYVDCVSSACESKIPCNQWPIIWECLEVAIFIQLDDADMQFIGNFGYVAVCIVGAYLVTTDAITIETIVAFIIYIRLFTQKPNLLKWEQIYNQRKRPVSGYLNFWKKKNWMRNIRNLQKWSMLKGR